jgi:hypothetical protein
MRCLEGCVRYAAWFVGGMRAVLGYCAGGGLPLPYAKASSAIAWGVILFGPEPYCQDENCTRRRIDTPQIDQKGAILARERDGR